MREILDRVSRLTYLTYAIEQIFYSALPRGIAVNNHVYSK